MTENKSLVINNLNLFDFDYPISKPDSNGPEYKKYVYQCSAIPPVIIQKVSDAEYNKYKHLECSPYINVFSEFFINRQFSSFSYSPVIVSLLNNKNTNKINSFIAKYFNHLKTTDTKIEITLDNPSISFDNLDKNNVYTISLSKTLKHSCNIYIDEDLPDFVKNEYLLQLKEKVGAVVVYLDSESESTKTIFINNFLRTYADIIFFDKVDKKIFDTFSYIGCKSNIQIDIDKYLLCLDRTVLWNEFKSY